MTEFTVAWCCYCVNSIKLSTEAVDHRRTKLYMCKVHMNTHPNEDKIRTSKASQHCHTQFYLTHHNRQDQNSRSTTQPTRHHQKLNVNETTGPNPCSEALFIPRIMRSRNANTPNPTPHKPGEKADPSKKEQRSGPPTGRRKACSDPGKISASDGLTLSLCDPCARMSKYRLTKVSVRLCLGVFCNLTHRPVPSSWPIACAANW